MDLEVNGSETIRTGSFSRGSSTNSSVRRYSLGLEDQLQVDDDIESRSVSEAGDIGDRALHSDRFTVSGRPRLSASNLGESRPVDPLPEDDGIESQSVSEAGDIGDRALLSDRFSVSGRSRLSAANLGESRTVVPVPEDELRQLQLEAASPLPAGSVFNSGGKTKEKIYQLSHLLLSLSCLVHLAVLGILGVLTRYILGKLFGPGVVGATSDASYIYHDLPSNMVGSFLMGWWGAVFKSDISRFSSQLAIGLTTGYLGSLTTFSGWNQKMIELSVNGQWVFAMLGFFVGMLLVAVSFTFGVHTAKGFKWTLRRVNTSSESGIIKTDGNWKIDSPRRQATVFVLMVLILGLLWGLSGSLMKRNFNSDIEEAQLWFSCIIGPIGVWIRFYLARLNGRGLGNAGHLKWIPFGTLIANVSAACVMAALATIKKEVNGKSADILASGLQIGLCGCLSTVSTFVAEFIAMVQSKHPWRAYVYASTTIVISFSLSTLIYSVPSWTKDYD